MYVIVYTQTGFNLLVRRFDRRQACKKSEFLKALSPEKCGCWSNFTECNGTPTPYISAADGARRH